MNRVHPSLLALIISLCLVAPAHAALVISADNVLVGPGFSEVQVDVWIRAASADVTLTNFDFEFLVAPVAGTSSELRFLNPQQDLQLSDPNYVFAGGSVRRDGLPPFFSAGPVGDVSESVTPDDTFDGGDISHDGFIPFAPVTLTTDRRLLVRLQLIPDPDGVTPDIGDQFVIDLIEEPITTFGGLTYEFEGGTITVGEGPVTVIPEPSGLTIFAGLAAFGLAAGWWRRWPALSREGAGGPSGQPACR